MTTTLITGGSVHQATEYAAQQIGLGDRVVILHEIPDGSVAQVPSGAIAIFDIAEDGLSSEEVADIYGARRIVNLDGVRAPRRAPRQLI